MSKDWTQTNVCRRCSKVYTLTRTDDEKERERERDEGEEGEAAADRDEMRCDLYHGHSA